LLRDKNVASSHKAGALGLLAALVSQIPAEVRQELEAIVAADPERNEVLQDQLLGDGDLTGALTDLAAALGTLDDEASAGRLLDLLGGDFSQRQWAAQVARRLNRPEHTGILVALAHDSDPSVRAVAAMGLASLVAAGQGDAVALSGLQRCLSDPGILVPHKIASVLASWPKRNQEAKDALTALSTHISARIRSLAGGADAGYGMYKEHPLNESDEWGDLESFHDAVRKT